MHFKIILLTNSSCCDILVVIDDRGALSKEYRTFYGCQSRAKKVLMPKRVTGKHLAGNSDNIRFAVAEMRRAIQQSFDTDVLF